MLLHLSCSTFLDVVLKWEPGEPGQPLLGAELGIFCIPEQGPVLAQQGLRNCQKGNMGGELTFSLLRITELGETLEVSSNSLLKWETLNRL